MADKQVPKQLAPFIWKKGQTGNPKGRPPGKTVKEFAKDYLMSIPDEEKIDFLASLPADLVWRMAEGQPHQTHTTAMEATVSLIVTQFNGDTIPPQLESGETPTLHTAEQG